MTTDMLAKAIEIEGLLRIIRDGNPLPETYALLKAKGAALAEMIDKLEPAPEEEATPETPVADFVMAAPEEDEEAPRVVFEESEPEEEKEKECEPEKEESHAEPAAEDCDLPEDDDIILTFDDPNDDSYDQLREAIDITITALEEERVGDEETDTTAEGEYEISYIAEDEEYEAPDIIVEGEFEEDEPSGEEERASEKETAPEPEPAKTIDLKSGAPIVKKVNIKSAFSLNDRFLYSRELFGGNMKLFDSTIAHIEEYNDFEDIESYFYKDLGWNPENSHATAFLETVRKNMSH